MDATPRRFRVGQLDPTTKAVVKRYRYGCYFPGTDLVVGDMGGRGREA